MFSHALDLAQVDRRVGVGLAERVLEPGVAQRVRIMARLYEAAPSGARVSGEAVAGLLGISRAAVHKHMEALRLAGVALDSMRGGGYRLSAPPDAIVPEAVLPLLLGAVNTGTDDPCGATPPAIGLPYLYFAAMDSTNASLKEIAQHERADRSAHSDRRPERRSGTVGPDVDQSAGEGPHVLGLVAAARPPR